MKRLVITLASLVVSACGMPESGVDSNKNLDSLTREERTQICQFVHDVAPSDGEYNCVGGQRTIQRNLAGCIDRSYWGGGQEECTVGRLEACYAVIAEAGTWCGLDLLGPCESARRCGFSSP